MAPLNIGHTGVRALGNLPVNLLNAASFRQVVCPPRRFPHVGCDGNLVFWPLRIPPYFCTASSRNDTPAVAMALGRCPACHAAVHDPRRADREDAGANQLCQGMRMHPPCLPSCSAGGVVCIKVSDSATRVMPTGSWRASVTCVKNVRGTSMPLAAVRLSAWCVLRSVRTIAFGRAVCIGIAFDWWPRKRRSMDESH